MHPSPSFLALYIYVSLLSVVRSSVTSLATLRSFLCLILSSLSPSTLVSSIFILSLRRPYFSIPYTPYEPFPIVQINLILTTPALV